MMVVTPSMFVGSEVDAALEKDAAYVESPNEAFHVIREGGTAVLPIDGDWQTIARDTLARLGATPEHIEQQLHYAQTGRFL